MSREPIQPSSGDEPILLTRASLEHVLDVFPAEEAAVHEDDARPSAAPASVDLFASEQVAGDGGMASLTLRPPSLMTHSAGASILDTARQPLEDERPWHTYDVAPSAAPAAALRLPAAAGGVHLPRFTPKMIAAALLTAVAVSAIAIGGVRQRVRTMDVAGAQAAAAPSNTIERPASAVSDPATGSIESSGGDRSVASRSADATAPGVKAPAAKPMPTLPANPTGRVLKGSLAPQPDSLPATGVAESTPAPSDISSPPAPPVPANARTGITPEPRETTPPRVDETKPAAEEPRPAAPSPRAPSPAVSEPSPTARPAASVASSAPPAAAPAPPSPAATATAPSSAAVPAPPPAPPATTVAAATDANAIQGVLGRYRHAFSELDPNAAKAVWPSVDARVLGRAFDQLQQQELDFQTCEIAVNGPRATASCSGRARYVPKVGSKSARDESRHWTFNLRKVDEQWLIEGVSSK